MFSFSKIHSEGYVVEFVFARLSEKICLVEPRLLLDLNRFCEDDSPLYEWREVRTCVEAIHEGEHVWLECSMKKTSLVLLVKIRTDPFTINDPVPAGWDYPYENNA